ncbi:hypothetical protein AMTRI_Chr02g212370 [Amborella trichopoda]|uniref:Cytochrome P450 n=1 Tax=Amborella trichopoda TaxID=13333 RepID=W1NWT8_AMBTC|nr:cytochrome P450 703A2 [Amborella trichopoda]ERM99149.1 hypothetical protein AMTR_s00092p00018750 [Amborella trichopoda]|eukprot:XP_006836296.1 cytochrome P450 703A2 [Amborella trichopoda]
MDLSILTMTILSITLASMILALRILQSSKVKIRLPPGPPRWPIVGNLLQLGPLPHKDFASFCSKYGPLVYLRLGNVDSITTNDPEIIKEILLKQDDAFASRPKTLAAIHLAYNSGDVALAPFGKHWKHMRRICMEHLLSTKRLESFQEQRRQEAQFMVSSVYRDAMHGKTINLREVLGAFSMNNVTRMILGKQYFGAGSAGPDEAAQFMDTTHELFWLMGVIYLGDYLPFWRWLDPYRCEEKMRDVEKRMDAFHVRILEEHRRRTKVVKEGSKDETMDFVDILLSLPGEDGKEHMEDIEIKALVQDMIAAATDTSLVTNEWAMAEVIRNPRILKKLQDELDTVVGKDRMVVESDLNHLQFLRCIVRETFRMHPAGPFLIPHESLRPTKLAGFDVPEKTRIFINAYALGRNPKIWDNVDEFYPERHMTVDGGRIEISHGADFKILPFSAGKRKCPGAPLGLCFVLLGLARLFHAFNWYPPKGMSEKDIDVNEVYGLTMPKANPLLAMAKPRLPSHLY